MTKSLPKTARDNCANQLNPTHPAYHQSRSASPADAKLLARSSKPVLDNRSNQLNPNNAELVAPRRGRTAGRPVGQTKKR